MKKTLVTLLIACMMFSLCAVCSNAAIIPETEVTPQWDSEFTADVTLTFSGLNGVATGTAYKPLDYSRIEGSITLYEFNMQTREWVYMGKVTESSRLPDFEMEYQFRGQSGKGYKAEFVVTAYKSDSSDSLTRTATSYCYY